MPTISAAHIDVHVFRREGVTPLYLVLHRAPHVRYGGLWRMVAGKVEEGETAVVAALREVYEETGLRVSSLWALDYVHSFYDPVEDAVKIVPVFAAEVTTNQVALSAEHDASRWITYDQVLDILRWPGQREGVRRVHTDIVTAQDRGAAFRIRPND